MATQTERILNYLAAHPRGANDDLLASELGIAHRQAVNQTCRRLASQGILMRDRDPVSGKIINRMSDGDGTAVAPATSSVSAANRPEAVPVTRVVTLAGDQAVRQFVYAGEVDLTEDQVKQAVEGALRQESWNVDTRWGRAHGIDIEARRGAERLVLEAKGEGSRPAMRVNFFLGALGELLQRMDSPAACYGLALPAHRQFAGLVSRLPAWVRARLNLRFYLVRPTSGGYEVGLVRPGDEAAPSQQQTSRTREPIPTLDAEAP